MNKRRIGVLQLAVVAIVLISSTLAIVYALTILWSAQVGVKVVDTVGLAVYTDQACTNPISSIDFGDQKKGAAASVTLYVKNTGTSSITLDYSSNAPTSILASDDFVYSNGASWANIRGYQLKAGEVLATKYEIYILPTAATGSKTWTLNLGSS